MTVSDAVRKVTKAELKGFGNLELKVKVGDQWYTVQDIQMCLDNAVITVKEN